MNLVLTGAYLPFHNSKTDTFILDVCVIQYVLRNNVIPKVGDKVHITLLLSVVTYFFLFHTQFDFADLLLHHIASLSIIWDPNFNRDQTWP